LPQANLDSLRNLNPHPRFDDAVAALDSGDLERLQGLIAVDPALVQARTNLEPPSYYFTGASLLHHFAYNPSRGPRDGNQDAIALWKSCTHPGDNCPAAPARTRAAATD